MVKIIGLCGTIGAGKGEVGKYLKEEYGYTQFTVGDIVREETRKKGLNITRDNTDRVSEELREKHGQDYFVKRIVEKIKEEDVKRAIIDGIRLPSDSKIFREEFGDDYILLKVDADPEIRFKRLRQRGRPGFPKTLEEFKKHEKRQYEMFNLNKTFSLADEVIKNNFSRPEPLHKKVNKLKKDYPEWF